MAIPGVTTIIRDRFYSVSRSNTPAGPRIVVIAKRDTADDTENVSDLDIVLATTEKDVIAAFGEGSDLHKAFLELISAGAERIYMVPLPSTTAFNHTDGYVTATGYTLDALFDAAYAAAETVLPDIIVPWGRGGNSDDWEDPATPSDTEYGFHANNSSTYGNSWVYKAAVRTKNIAENIHPCISILGVKPYDAGTKEVMTPAAVASHLALSTLVSRDVANLKEYGPYVCVIATEIKPVSYGTSTGDDYGYANGACAMAASLSKLAAYSSVTAKPIYNVESMRYAPTRTQQEALADKGVNSVVLNFNKIAVFGDGLTFAATGSDYSRLSTKRVVDETANVVRQSCQKFVGEPSTIQMRTSMETAISSALRGMQLLGALLASDFNVTYVPDLNKAIVDLIITPAFELKSIEVQIAVNI
jgi:hypothetical protein